MNVSRSSKVAAVVLASAIASTNIGCSAMYVRPAHSFRSSTLNLDCTKTQGAPRGDAVLSVLGSGITYLGLTAHDETFEGRSFTKEEFIAMSLVPTLVFAGSAVYGFIETSKCARLTKRSAGDDE